MMAQRFPRADVKGIDISDDAVGEAIYNVSKSPFAERVKIGKADFRNFQDEGIYDAVVCNPPYFEKSLKCPEMGRSMARHTDTLSIEELVSGTSRILTENGTLSLVLPYSMCDEAANAGIMYGFALKRMMKVRGNADGEWKRILICMAKGYCGECSIEELTLEESRGVRTKEYTALTQDFYL